MEEGEEVMAHLLRRKAFSLHYQGSYISGALCSAARLRRDDFDLFASTVRRIELRATGQVPHYPLSGLPRAWPY